MPALQNVDARTTPDGGGWTTVWLLALITVVSWLDRLVLTLLVTPIQAELGLDDGQFGWLMGMGFVAVFVLAGMPVATALDRGNRKWILVGAGMLWCASTVAAAFADTFGTLLVLRAGVAIGEAALMPAAVSMISDHFAPERRRGPTSVLMGVNILGATAAFLIGGLVIAWATRVAPGLGWSSWRLTLLAVGAMGLPVIGLFAWRGREPRRRDAGVGTASAATTLAHLRAVAPLYLGMFVGAGLVLMLAQGSAAWLSTLLVRGHQLAPARTGPLMAMVFAPTSLLGVTLLPWLIGRRSGQALVLRVLWLALGVCALAVPFVLVAGSGRLPALLASGALAMLGQGAVVALVATLIQAITPGAMRARVTAVFYLFMNLIAGGLAPVAVATAASRLFAGPHALGSAMALVAGVGTCSAAILLLAAVRWSRQQAFATS